MANRREFIQQAGIASVGVLLAATDVVAAESAGYVDKLIDANGKYEAAPLPFSYDALEPHIDARTVELHYNFHHKPAVTAANKAEEALFKARETNDFALVKYYEKELVFQLSSHILHTIYWTSISGKGAEPSGSFAKAIDRDFGSYSKFKGQLLAATAAVEASGWGLVGYHPATDRIMILQCENHQKLTAWGIQPLLVLDVFEHAYYLKYQNKRADYLNQLLSLLNWDNAALRWQTAQINRKLS